MSSAGSCLQTRPSTASLAWPRTLAPTVSPEPSTTCRSRPPCMERATSEHSVSRPDAGPPAYSNQPPRPPKCPVTTLLFIFFFFFLVCLWPYLFVIILCLLLLFSPSTCPASPPLPHTLSPLYLLPTQCSSSPGLQRGRDKKYFFFCFYFLVVIVFLHEMNKVNIFYYTEQKRYFSSPD